MALDQTELAQIVSAVIQALKVGDTSAKPASLSAPVDKLAQRDAAIRAGFARRGIKNVTLMNRADRKQSYDVKPYGVWLSEGWQVKKGQRSVKGLFHQSQCDRIAPAKATTKSPVPAEQQQIFAQAKAVLLKKKQAKKQPTLV
jgi:hypothetical protein